MEIGDSTNSEIQPKYFAKKIMQERIIKQNMQRTLKALNKKGKRANN